MSGNESEILEGDELVEEIAVHGLLDCPVCGSKPRASLNKASGEWHITCSNPFFGDEGKDKRYHSFTVIMPTIEEAIDVWNTRYESTDGGAKHY